MIGILPCQGTSNTGVMTTKAAMHFAKKQEASMVCPLGLPLGIEGIIKSCKNNEGHIALNGCGVKCASKALDSIGLTNYKEIELTSDFGILKNKYYDDEAGLNDVIKALSNMLHQSVLN